MRCNSKIKNSTYLEQRDFIWHRIVFIIVKIVRVVLVECRRVDASFREEESIGCREFLRFRLLSTSSRVSVAVTSKGELNFDDEIFPFTEAQFANLDVDIGSSARNDRSRSSRNLANLEPAFLGNVDV